MRIIHYQNHFFGLGGDASRSGMPPCLIDGPAGPGAAFAEKFADWGSIAATIVCGDDYMALHEDRALEVIAALLETVRPDALIAGPAFAAGRYGLACGAVAALARKKLGIPVITGMHPENPGAELYAAAVPIVRTQASIAGMREAVASMSRTLRATVCGKDLSPEDAEGLIPAHAARLFTRRTGAAKPLTDLGRATVALITEGGLTPRGNPDQLESFAARQYRRYALDGAANLAGSRFVSVHGGIDRELVAASPDRLLPVDVMREFAAEGVIGSMPDWFLTTTGNGASFDACREMGRNMAKELKRENMHGVLLTAT